MKTILVLVAIGVVVLLVVLVGLLRRKSKLAKAAKVDESLQNLQKNVLPEPKIAVNKTVVPEPEKVLVSPEISKPVENQPAEQPVIAAIIEVVRTESIPEDSMLRRHYLSNLEAERMAITHPYPTDSVLRRHYESGLAWQLTSSLVAGGSPLAETTAETENCVAVEQEQPESKRIIPEDSTLRRHFLSQIQAEVETNLSPRPTDATLRRHYDSLVKSRVEAYIQEIAA